jgi:hypothetical protein
VAFDYAWATPEILVNRHNGLYYIREYTECNTRRWDCLDMFTAQAVLIHLTQGGNDEDA